MADPTKHQETWQSANYEPYKKDIVEQLSSSRPGIVQPFGSKALKKALTKALDSSITGAARSRANKSMRKQQREVTRTVTKTKTRT